MHRISTRLKSVSGSPTVQLAGMIAEMKARGEDVISFAIGEPDFPTPANIVEATKKALDEGFTKYTSSMGIMKLREAVAKQYTKKGWDTVKQENVLISSTKYSVFMTVFSLIEEGDEVIVPDPCWTSYEPIVRLAGGKPILVEATEDAKFELTPESVADAVTDRTKMIIINTPSNPGGCVFSKDTVRGLCDLAKDHDLYIVSDEIYDRLVYEGEHYSPAAFQDMFNRTVTVNGFSKTYAMTGWRVGWLVAEKSLVKEMSKIQEHTITCVTSFVQKGAITALEGQETSFGDMLEEFRARRDLMGGLLEDIGVFEFILPRGAFYIFPKYSMKIDSKRLAEELLVDARVAVTPGVAFGPSGEGHLRFSYATSREDIEKGISRIKEALKKRGRV